MGYKNHSGLTNAEVGNVPDRNPWIECEGCGRRERFQSIKDDDWDEWQKSGDPTIPLLCPECEQKAVSVEERRENNRDITGWSQ